MFFPGKFFSRPSDVVDDCQDSRKSEIPEIRGSAEIRDTGRNVPRMSSMIVRIPENPRSRKSEVQPKSEIPDGALRKIRDTGRLQPRKSEIPEKNPRFRTPKNPRFRRTRFR